MYLRKVHIENIRSIANLDWEIPEGQEAGWHVVIGDNGSGKSTFLRAIALALIGIPEAGIPWMFGMLGQRNRDWVRKNAQEGEIGIQLVSDPTSAKSATRKNGTRAVLSKNEGTGLLPIKIFIPAEDSNNLSPQQGHDPSKFKHSDSDLTITNPQKGIGFSAAYGPFRRFTGGDFESEKIFSASPRLGAHLSIFRENVALTEALTWLKDLDYREKDLGYREQKELPSSGGLLEKIRKFVNQDCFLPYNVQLTDISPNGVIFQDGNGVDIPVEELSDGYRSILSMTFDLIRRISDVFEPDQFFSPDDSSKIIASGIVLIDEVDAHLHPTWQRRIGLWFREHFPNIQFIVTTHSPLVCQAAEHGTVWRLPAPGSGEKAEMVTGDALNQLLYGNVLDAYGTELFGENVTRSETALKKLERLAKLNQKGLRGKLTTEERTEQAELRRLLPMESHALNGDQ